MVCASPIPFNVCTSERNWTSASAVGWSAVMHQRAGRHLHIHRFRISNELKGVDSHQIISLEEKCDIKLCFRQNYINTYWNNSGFGSLPSRQIDFFFSLGGLKLNRGNIELLSHNWFVALHKSNRRLNGGVLCKVTETKSSGNQKKKIVISRAERRCLFTRTLLLIFSLPSVFTLSTFKKTPWWENICCILH